MIDTAPTSTPIETVTKILPSEAIPLGRLQFPEEIRRTLWAGTKACALGAMLVGLGYPPESFSWIGFLESDYYQSLSGHVQHYIGNITHYFDDGCKTEREIIEDLKALGA